MNDTSIDFAPLYFGLVIGALFVLFVYSCGDSRVAYLVRQKTNLLAQVIAISFGAQLVALVYFMGTLQQQEPMLGNRGLLIDSAGNLIIGALISTIALLSILLYFAIEDPPESSSTMVKLVRRYFRSTFSFVALLSTFVVLAQLVFLLPFVLLASLP